MLKRIRDKKSAYNVQKMEQHRKDVEKNISLISEFKYKNYPVTQTKVNVFYFNNKVVYDRRKSTCEWIKNIYNS